MSTKVLIKETDRNYITCILENDEWKEILAEPRNKSILHNIYVGKVTSVSVNIEAAFVSIGNENCYLPFKECAGRIPKVGEELLVQVVKESIKTKDAMVSCNLSISGQYFALTTGNRKIGVSAKITDSSKRKELTVLVNEVLKEEYSFGVVVRTNAANEKAEDLKPELENLCTKLHSVCSAGKTRTCYSLLYKSPASYLERIRDIRQSELDRIVTDSREVYEELKHVYPTELYQDNMLSLDKLYRFESNIAEALKKKVWLKSGGYLIIEPTEALTVIDVNSGKFTGKKTSKETYRMINRDAAKEIARQLRLRNLSGIIIVDFINMKEKENGEELIQYLSALVKGDKIRTNVLGLTSLGLMEITRMKVRKPVRQQLWEAGYEISEYS